MLARFLDLVQLIFECPWSPHSLHTTTGSCDWTTGSECMFILFNQNKIISYCKNFAIHYFSVKLLLIYQLVLVLNQQFIKESQKRPFLINHTVPTSQPSSPPDQSVCTSFLATSSPLCASSPGFPRRIPGGLGYHS